jgi:hypothetical protein
MADLIYTPWLSAVTRNDSLVFASKTVRFPESDVVAHVSLSALSDSAPERYQPFRRSGAEAWIESPESPHLAGFTVHHWARDAQAQVRTSWLTFWLRADSGAAAAVGAVLGAPGVSIFGVIGGVVLSLDWVRFTADGRVLGVHSLVLLEGAEPVDPDDAERELRESPLPGVDEDLQVLRFNPADFPADAALGVDPGTGEVFAYEPPRVVQAE